MKRIAILYLLYALFIAAGGVIALLVAQSKISFILSTATASLIFLFAILALNRNSWSIYGCYFLNIMLSIVFFIRFRATMNFMPAGLSLLISLSLLLISMRSHYQYHQAKVQNP